MDSVKWHLARSIFLFFCCRLCFGQVGLPGPCPNVSPLDNFNVTAYSGKWFENSRFFTVGDIGRRCISAVYTATGTNSFSISLNRTNRITDVPTIIQAQANPINSGGTQAWYRITYLSNPILELGLDSKYMVIATDFTSFSVVWDCTNLFLYNFQVLRILTRARSPAATVVTNAQTAIDDLGLYRDSLVTSIQTLCD